MAKTYRVGDQVFTTPYEDLFRPLTAEERAGLRTSVLEKGIMVPVIVNYDAEVIDGAHRVAIAEELGITTLNFTVFAGRSKEEERALAIDLNRHRRHLTPEDRQVLALRMRQEGKSCRQIADAFGVDVATAHRDLQKATVANATVAMPERIVGKDGRSRPAMVPAGERQPDAPGLSGESGEQEAESASLRLSNGDQFKLIYQLLGKVIRAVDKVWSGCEKTKQEHKRCLVAWEKVKEAIVALEASKKQAARQE